MVKEQKAIIRSQKKGIINAAYRQGCAFKKFKGSGKFVEKVKKIGVSKSTVYFGIKLVKF